MSTRYADRAFLSINGVPLVDVQSADLKQNHNAKAVPSMTNDKFNRGFVQGNTDIDITLTIALDNNNPRPKLEAINYGDNDMQLTFVVGSDQFVCTGLFIKDNTDTAGGIGDEVKTSFTFGALKVIDSVGNGILFNLSL